MLEIISLGAGVQSSCMALMAAKGEITPMPDAAIFADVGAEPKAVYDWLEYLTPLLPFPVHVVKRSNILEEQLSWSKSKDGTKYLRNVIPAYVLNDDGSQGMLLRKCTGDWKIAVIERKQKELAGIKPYERVKETRVRSWQGISQDEIQRARMSTSKWMEIRYPLLEQGMTRGHCLEWMRDNGFPPPPKSACTICPYRSNEQWQALTDEEMAEAVDFERKWNEMARNDPRKTQVRGEIFLHRSMVPLDQADFSTAKDHGQNDMFEEECQGMCGL